jgi:hypothetical protein
MKVDAMNAPLAERPILARLDAEWQRLELLCWCLARSLPPELVYEH